MRRGLVWGTVVGLALGAGTGCSRGTRPSDTNLTAGGKGYLEEGLASYYNAKYNGRATASGEKLDPKKLTAAHRTLPFGTCLRVVNMENGRSVEVRVNDRGPFKEGRVVDVSQAGAERLELLQKGLARVRLYRCETRTSSLEEPFSEVPFESRAG
ncbi:septal ring lytic transglycosylase RlpA family protein [Melittangium boletus]|uniref:septal ring lytic transglycosylase RlpA family protein n=1 Tax=Melittangium boletus TaxID=83453 RepID=UPI003DA2EA7B